jgi:tetratricopeptide (TPR) repeat protein
LHYEFFTKRLNLPQTADAQAEKNHQLLAEASVKDPDNVQLWQVRTKLFLRQRKFGEALQALNQGIEAASRIEVKGILAQFQSEVLLENALAIAAEQGEATTRVQRLTLLSQAVRINPGNRRAVEQLVVLGFPLNSEANDQWLFEAKAGAQAGSPLYYGVNMLLGLKALFADDQTAANQYLNLAAGLGPGFSQVLQALTLAIDPNAKDLLAEHSVNTSGAPTELPSAPALFGIYMILGSRAVVEKKYDRGLDFFRKANEANPNSNEAINNMAYCMINRENATPADFQHALELATKIIESNPNVPNFYETRGAIQLKLADYLSAINDFEKALALGFQNRALVHKNLVIACRALGREAEADAYQKMLDNLPDSNPAPASAPATETTQAQEAQPAEQNPPAEANTDAAATGGDKGQGATTDPPVGGSAG